MSFEACSGWVGGAERAVQRPPPPQVPFESVDRCLPELARLPGLVKLAGVMGPDIYLLQPRYRASRRPQMAHFGHQHPPGHSPPLRHSLTPFIPPPTPAPNVSFSSPGAFIPL